MTAELIEVTMVPDVPTPPVVAPREAWVMLELACEAAGVPFACEAAAASGAQEVWFLTGLTDRQKQAVQKVLAGAIGGMPLMPKVRVGREMAEATIGFLTCESEDRKTRSLKDAELSSIFRKMFSMA